MQMTLGQLKVMQSMPRREKLYTSNARIDEWWDYWYGNVGVSISGGLDSSVLLHMVRKRHPEVPAITLKSLECKNNQKIIEDIDNVVVLKPIYSKVEVLNKFGYPIGSKKIAKSVRRLQNPTPKNLKSRNLALTGITSDGRESRRFKLSERWLKLVNSKFRISEQCCYYMKEKPQMDYRKETECAYYIGTKAEDSSTRKSLYIGTGCNSYKADGNSTPLGFWTHQDVLEYIVENNIPISKEYGEIVRLKDGTLTTTKASRTGYFICGFGCHMEKYPNRWQRMQVDDPQLYKFAMETLGYRELLEFLDIPYSIEQAPKNEELYSQITIKDLTISI